MANKLTSNNLLAAVPQNERSLIWPHLEPVPVVLVQVLMSAEQPVGAIWFPESGVVSMLLHMSDGRTAEVGLVGREGMVGLPVVLGTYLSSTEAIVQNPGAMLRMAVEPFRRAMEEAPVFRCLMLRYGQSFQDQITQTAACNGIHTLDQRIARWLLTARARNRADAFPMTHEFLAMMLCVHRPGVTVAARMLKQAGLIDYGRGQMRIVDPTGLEEVSCECYATVRRRFENLFGPDK